MSLILIVHNVRLSFLGYRMVPISWAGRPDPQPYIVSVWHLLYNTHYSCDQRLTSKGQHRLLIASLRQLCPDCKSSGFRSEIAWPFHMFPILLEPA